MSLVPRNTSNNPTPFPPFPQDFWDRFFSHDHWLEPFRNLPFPFPSPFPFHSSFPFPPFSGRTVPYTDLAVQISGDVRARMECKEIPEAHIIAAELPGVEKNEVEVAAEEGGFVRISGGGGRFLWRFRLPEDAKLHLMNWSMENGMLTVVIPKLTQESDWGWERESEDGGRNVRQIEITSLDD